MRKSIVGCVACLVFVCPPAPAIGESRPNLLDDPSFEVPKQRDQFGLVFAKWGGWKYEGDCSFAVGQVARTGKHSCLLVGGAGAKIRTVQLRELEPGRYQITAYLRGLDIGTGVWNSTIEFMFDGKYMRLHKSGTFGWTKLTYVAEIGERKQAGPSFGMFAPGYFWIDDVSLVRVGDDVPLTSEPVLSPAESSIAPPGNLTSDAVRCPECGYRNMPVWKQCYACGSSLANTASVPSGPPVRLITSLEEENPFSGGTVVTRHATDGTKALRIDRSYAVMDGPQDWSGYDYLKADLHVETDDPLQLYVEVRDSATRDYWTRVNYTTVAPPGQSTLIIPIKHLYVGEKSRPGRMLMLGSITRLVFSIGEHPQAPLFVDNVRLERDNSMQQAAFDGLQAFDFGSSTSPVMDGFQPITPGTIYSQGRGYGLQDARIWRTFDALQPDPLYQDFVCIERGGLAVDVPNGRYRVFVNIDSPSGFWGEYQVYRRRGIVAEGEPVVTDKMEFAQFQEKYFRFWNVEDQPADNTFDKYQKAYFREKTFDVEVTDGQLNIEFQGENWGCCVSAVVIFPVAKAAQGEAFLKCVEQKRRSYFDNYFKRVLHRPTGSALQPSAEDERRGYVVFQRDWMQDVYYNDTPLTAEIGGPLGGEAFAGEQEPLTVSVVPLRDLGPVTVSVSNLRCEAEEVISPDKRVQRQPSGSSHLAGGPAAMRGPAGVIPASAIDIGFVSYRISRVTMEGSVYTIRPRLIMPTNTVDMPRDVTRRFWLTVKTPIDAKPGLYRGMVTISPREDLLPSPRLRSCNVTSPSLWEGREASLSELSRGGLRQSGEGPSFCAPSPKARSSPSTLPREGEDRECLDSRHSKAARSRLQGEGLGARGPGISSKVPIEFRVRAGTLDPVDIPAGPWGYTISTAWYRKDPAAASWNRDMMEQSLRKMREYGFTTCSGIPSIPYRGFQNGKPVLDFATADARMRLVKDLGFLAVVSYGGGVSGFNAYFQDTAAMNAAGFEDYAEFVKAVYTAVQQHADQEFWIPVYYNLGDEPLGDALARSAENAKAYRTAFPKGPPLFTAASSFSGGDQTDPHFRLSRLLHVANWNGHDEVSVNLLHAAGSDWAFYNGGNRWTFGDYLYKAAKQFNMQFRIAWHWNVVAGDPYYALDCREDDYAWCNSSPDGQLIPSIHFERLREGLDDYRRLLTAARLAREQAGTPAAQRADELIATRLAAFKLGQRDHDSLFDLDDWTRFRRQVDDAIEALRED